MSTTFRHNGEEVAHRFSGGATRGVQIELRPGAASVNIFTHLEGDDGSTETLQTLAQQIGQGRARDWVQRLAQRADAHFAEAPKVIDVEERHSAGLVDAVNRVAEALERILDK